MLRITLSFMLLLPLGACVDTNLKPKVNQADTLRQARLAREVVMQDAWIGKSIQQVEASLGEPQMVMDIPGTRSVSVMVYDVLDAGSRCIDTFEVVHGEVPTVINYYCR